jgi:hypothetical protein
MDKATKDLLAGMKGETKEKEEEEEVGHVHDEYFR